LPCAKWPKEQASTSLSEGLDRRPPAFADYKIYTTIDSFFLPAAEPAGAEGTPLAFGTATHPIDSGNTGFRFVFAPLSNFGLNMLLDALAHTPASCPCS